MRREDENGDIVPVPSTVVMHPMVGIFWFIEMGKDDDFVYDAVPISQGEKYGDAIGYGEHYAFWEKHFPQTCAEVIFKDSAYDAYPSGRIVFLPNENKFVVYIDKCICTDDLVKIIEKFQIDDVDIAIEENGQYRCLKCKSLFINCYGDENMSTHENGKDDDFYLSKSLFVRGVRCHKSLYLHKYRPELKDEVSEETEKLFNVGFEVGDLARELFPNGEIVPYDGLSHEEQIEMTASLIAKGCKTIYEATFFYNGVFIKADIIHQGDNGWDVYEVKASTEVKDYHLHDASVQYYVIAGTGLPLSRVFVVHVNNQYVRQGEIEIDKLFHKEDITAIAKEEQDFIVEEIKRQRAMLKGDEPAIDIGPQCNQFYPCDFIGYCWSHIPNDSIFDIRGRMDSRFFLYEKGLVSMFDVPQEYLSTRQFIQLDAAKTKEAYHDHDAVRQFIKSLWYPMYFLDFETFMQAIPLYDGTRPYQQIPFQYSLHHLEHKGSDLKHHEFLAMPRTDPRKELIEKLVNEIPDNACVLVYSKSFEIGRLHDLAGWFPEYADKIEKIIENIRDLMEPFQRYDIYHWQQSGSYSLKDVLPAMVPDLNYDNMEISDGGMAMDAYFRMCKSDDPREIERVRKSLLDYCGLDTMAMVRIVDKLKEYA